MSLREGSHLRLCRQPLAASYEGDFSFSVNFLFLFPHLVRQVFAAGMRQLGAVSARFMKPRALFGIVANARHGPEVVHRPHHAFATLENALQTLEREPPLVDPV